MSPQNLTQILSATPFAFIRSVFVHRLAVLVAITAVALIPFSVGAQTDRFWQGPPGGQWDVNANWTLGAPGFPNAAGDGALNIQTTTTSTTQATPGGVTVGKIGHDAVNVNTSWTITATTAITLNNLGAGAIIRNTNTSTGASNFLSITGAGGLILADNLNITNTSGSTASAGAIRISAPISGAGNITISNVSNSFTDARGAVALQGANTFVGTTTIAKGLTTFNNSGTFSSGQINLGQSGQGDASLVSTTSGVNAANNIVVAAGTGGSSLLGSSTSGTATYSGLITLNGNVTLTNLNSSGTGTTTYSNTISGSGGVRVIGPGISLLSKANTFLGATTVDSGTLNASVTGALGSTSSVTVNSTGTLLLSGASTDRINNSAGMTLNGGTLRLGGVSEGVRATVGIGALTLSSSSIIDLASTSLVHFDASNTQPWLGTLSIYNWSGTPVTGGGAEAILFGTNTTSLTQLQLNQISFYSDSGTTFLGTGAFATIGDGEVVPVPESSTWAAGILTVAALGYTQLRKGSRAGGRRLFKREMRIAERGTAAA